VRTSYPLIFILKISSSTIAVKPTSLPQATPLASYQTRHRLTVQLYHVPDVCLKAGPSPVDAQQHTLSSEMSKAWNRTRPGRSFAFGSELAVNRHHGYQQEVTDEDSFCARKVNLYLWKVHTHTHTHTERERNDMNTHHDEKTNLRFYSFTVQHISS